jgi:hypothetical protein
MFSMRYGLGVARLVSVCVLMNVLLLCAVAQESPAGNEIHQGLFRGRLVTYQDIGGKAVFEGDMLLDHVTEPGGIQSDGLGIAYDQYLWPKVGSVYQVPYIITSGATNLASALANFNSALSGRIQFVARTSEPNYVNFNFDQNDQSGECESDVGMIGGEHEVGGSVACNVGTLLHEMGHTLGLYHEQSRADRDTYVMVMYNNIIKASRDNFDQLLDNAQSLGSYDFASIMHYVPFAFSRNGNPTLESIPAGIGLSNQVGYTAADLDGINRIYGFIPSKVTITTNPPGLAVTVDGVAVTTPKTYKWNLNSTHTLAIPSGSQTLAGTVYTYGRWSDKSAASHSVTVTPGNGRQVSPPTSPALTVYTANFIKLLPFNLAVYPTGAGTAKAKPAPQSYPPATGTYYVDRTLVKLTATPGPGQNFYTWWGYLPGPSGSNPLSGRTPYNTVTAGFTTSPVTTVTTQPAGHWLTVDGNFAYGPVNFALPYDSTWTAGSQHTVSTVDPQYPYSSSTRFAFSNWSDGGAITHNITLPAQSATYTAAFTPQYYLADWVTPGCAATLAPSPTSPDGFYDSGTSVQLTATIAAGWIFTGWQYDLSGTANPAQLTMADEELAVANFNTVTTPLTLSSLSPSAVPAGEAPFTLTINGTGFTSSTEAFVNGAYRLPTYKSGTKLTLAMQATDVATDGAFQVAVANFPTGAPCYVFVPATFYVLVPGSLIPTTTTLTSSQNPANSGTPVTFTAKVNPNTFPALGGMVTFKDGTTVLATIALNSSDQAAYTTSSLTSGTHSITATYNGNSSFATSQSSALVQTIN